MSQTTISFARGTWLDPKVHRVLAVPRRQTVSEWAADNRVLQSKDSAEPGKWSNRRAPYLTEIMDAFCDPEITDVVWLKAAQIGASEAMRNVLAYWIAQDPGPALWVMPDEKSAEEALAERLTPMIKLIPSLAVHLTGRSHDVSRRKILLDHMEIHAAWATSPQSLASRPKRFVIYDEVDKYPAWSGNESDPIALGNKRRTTYGHRSKAGILSTPTTRAGAIWKAWESSPVRLRYHVPCPHCGEYAVMAWGQVRWPQDLPGTRPEQGTAIEEGALAWYDCPACGGRIEERQRDGMVKRGKWAADEYETVARDGTLVGRRPHARRVAFHVPALISPWVSWSQMAGEFVSSIGDEARMMDWRNSRLGEPYEVRLGGVKSDAFDRLIAAGFRPGIVPQWATSLLATADTQKDHFWYVIRAWGPSRSRLIACGRCETLEELRLLTFGTKRQSEDPSMPAMSCALLAIDSGGGGDIDSDMSRTQQVYRFALSDPARIVATKGWGGATELEAPTRQAFVTTKSPTGDAQQRLALYHLKTGYFKDVLASRISGEEGADGWEVHCEIDSTYRRQMASEHKVVMRRGRSQVARWLPMSVGIANHLWDCEAMQCALAQIANVDAPRPPPRRYGAIKNIGG